MPKVKKNLKIKKRWTPKSSKKFKKPLKAIGRSKNKYNKKQFNKKIVKLKKGRYGLKKKYLEIN